MKKTLSIALLFVVFVIAMYVFFKRDFDQFNPMYEEQYVYAVVNEAGKPEGRDYIRYRYNLTGYNEQGKKTKITFSSSVQLEPKTNVKVLAKGSYTKSWEIITQDDMPGTKE